MSFEIVFNIAAAGKTRGSKAWLGRHLLKCSAPTFNEWPCYTILAAPEPEQGSDVCLSETSFPLIMERKKKRMKAKKNTCRR